MTLIEIIREARELDCNWIAIDDDGGAFGYMKKPFSENTDWLVEAKDYDCHYYLGEYKLTCDWQDTLINLKEILVK